MQREKRGGVRQAHERHPLAVLRSDVAHDLADKSCTELVRALQRLVEAPPLVRGDQTDGECPGRSLVVRSYPGSCSRRRVRAPVPLGQARSAAGLRTLPWPCM